MRLKQYSVAALMFILAIGWYIYAFKTQASTSIDLFGIHMPSLPIALWVMVPAVLLFLASVMHIAFYSMLGSFKLRRYQHDYDKLMKKIQLSILNEHTTEDNFKTDRYQLLGKLIAHSQLKIDDTLQETNNSKLDDTIAIIRALNSGEVVELKKYNLPKDNIWVKRNNANKFATGKLSAEDILSKSDQFDATLVENALHKFVEDAPLFAIEKYKNLLDKKALFVILKRLNNAENHLLEISNETLIALFGIITCDSACYIEASKVLGENMVPEQRIKLFELLSEQNDEAQEAYIFTLFDLEMNEAAVELLENLHVEMPKLQAYNTLRQCGKHYDINLFV